MNLGAPKPNAVLGLQGSMGSSWMGGLWSFIEHEGNKQWIWLALEGESQQIVIAIVTKVRTEQRHSRENGNPWVA